MVMLLVYDSHVQQSNYVSKSNNVPAFIVLLGEMSVNDLNLYVQWGAILYLGSFLQQLHHRRNLGHTSHIWLQLCYPSSADSGPLHCGTH